MESQLHAAEIEQAFAKTHIDLSVVVVLDGIDLLSAPSGYLIRSHDLHGPLPHLRIDDRRDPHVVLENVRHAACRHAALAYIRGEVTRLTGFSFFDHELGETTAAEIDALLAGYRQLREAAVA